VRTVDVNRALATVHGTDCFGQRAARRATFAFTSLVRRPGGTATLTLLVHPGRERAGLEVERVLPTTLLSPTRQRNDWVVRRRVGAVPGRIVLPASPTRCDLHAIAEDKVGSVLPLLVRLDDGTTGLVDVVPPSRVRDAVLSWVSDTCAVGR
jgi:hypothetical protein